MTIQEVIDRILAYHPPLDRAVTCDGFKCGDPRDEVTGIVTTCCASVNVIRKAIELGANLIVCHEPVFYLHDDPIDWLEGNDVFEEKLKLCNEHGIAIWRDHDHIHTHRPDGIRYGLMKELGWENYLTGDRGKPIHFHIPETTVHELALFLKERIGLNGVRVIGNLDGKVRNVVVCGHILPGTEEAEKRQTELLSREDVDVLIPGELIDWTTTCYARDAGQLGKNKAIIHLGHINSEELGMKYAAVWVKELVGKDIPVQFVRSADLYQYVI